MVVSIHIPMVKNQEKKILFLINYLITQNFDSLLTAAGRLASTPYKNPDVIIATQNTIITPRIILKRDEGIVAVDGIEIGKEDTLTELQLLNVTIFIQDLLEYVEEDYLPFGILLENKK